MNSDIATNLVYNELEYFCYLNHWLLFLFFFILTFYSILKITNLYFNKIYYNDTFIEFLCTLFSLVFLLFIISPALIILLDIDSIIMPSFIIYTLGYQWAWTYSISYLHSNIGYTSYHDHYIMSSYFYRININELSSSIFTTYLPFNNTIHYSLPTLNIEYSLSSYYSLTNFIDWSNIRFSVPQYLLIYSLHILNRLSDYIHYSLYSTLLIMDSSYSNSANNATINYTTTSNYIVSLNPINTYLFEINTYLVIPLWSCIKIYLFSLDVIHSLSFYSFGFKIDAIPGRINLTSSLRSLIAGVNRGFCYELCGEQHNTMLNTWILA